MHLVIPQESKHLATSEDHQQSAEHGRIDTLSPAAVKFNHYSGGACSGHIFLLLRVIST
jgi:hypothetical protein